MDIYKNVSTAILILLLSSVNNFVHGQETELQSKGKSETLYFKSESLFKYDIKLPDNYNPGKKYQLVIGLHGGGSSIEQFISIWDSLANTDFIYAVPQAPYPWLLDKELGYDWALWPTGNSKLIKRASNLIGKYISDLTIFLKKQYSISDIYLFGFSQGAIFTYIAGIKNHNIYKGLIILSGPGLLEPLVSPFTGDSEYNWLEKDYIKSGNNLRIFIAHGKDDKMVKYELGVKSQSVLSDLGYDVTFQDFSGGHSVNSEILVKVIEWLKQ